MTSGRVVEINPAKPRYVLMRADIHGGVSWLDRGKFNGWYRGEGGYNDFAHLRNSPLASIKLIYNLRSNQIYQQVFTYKAF